MILIQCERPPAKNDLCYLYDPATVGNSAGKSPPSARYAWYATTRYYDDIHTCQSADTADTWQLDDASTRDALTPVCEP